MGSQQVLRTAAVLVSLCAPAAAAPRLSHEKIAIVDLGPDDERVRKQLAQAVVEAGLDPVIGDGVEDALAGQAHDPDRAALASAMADALAAFGALDCKATVAAADHAIELASARQAAGLPVPELAKAYAYELACADRTSDVDVAMRAASRLRTLRASDALLAKYPEVDALVDREMLAIHVEADVPGADVWIDHARAGVSPLDVALTAGAHVIAVSKGTRRGVAMGTVVKTQPTVTIPTTDQATQWTALANQIASWHGRVPPADEIAKILDAVHARVVVIRHGDVLEAWGRLGHKEMPHKLGNEEGTESLGDASKVMGLIVDRVNAWNDHAPDPDQPLLVESAKERAARKGGGAEEEPTKWWVYATVFGAVAAGALIIYAHDRQSDTQHVEVHVP